MEKSERRLLAATVKCVALAVGSCLTFVSIASLVGAVHSSAVVRFGVAGAVGLLLPIVVAPRIMPDALEQKTAGLTTDLLAVSWMLVS